MGPTNLIEVNPEDYFKDSITRKRWLGVGDFAVSRNKELFFPIDEAPIVCIKGKFIPLLCRHDEGFLLIGLVVCNPNKPRSL